jgi:hypothetical protein
LPDRTGKFAESSRLTSTVNSAFHVWKGVGHKHAGAFESNLANASFWIGHNALAEINPIACFHAKTMTVEINCGKRSANPRLAPRFCIQI